MLSENREEVSFLAQEGKPNPRFADYDTKESLRSAEENLLRVKLAGYLSREFYRVFLEIVDRKFPTINNTTPDQRINATKGFNSVNKQIAMIKNSLDQLVINLDDYRSIENIFYSALYKQIGQQLSTIIALLAESEDERKSSHILREHKRKKKEMSLGDRVVDLCSTIEQSHITDEVRASLLAEINAFFCNVFDTDITIGNIAHTKYALANSANQLDVREVKKFISTIRGKITNSVKGAKSVNDNHNHHYNDSDDYDLQKTGITELLEQLNGLLKLLQENIGKITENDHELYDKVDGVIKKLEEFVRQFSIVNSVSDHITQAYNSRNASDTQFLLGLHDIYLVDEEDERKIPVQLRRKEIEKLLKFYRCQARIQQAEQKTDNEPNNEPDEEIECLNTIKSGIEKAKEEKTIYELLHLYLNLPEHFSKRVTDVNSDRCIRYNGYPEPRRNKIVAYLDIVFPIFEDENPDVITAKREIRTLAFDKIKSFLGFDQHEILGDYSDLSNMKLQKSATTQYREKKRLPFRNSEDTNIGL